MARSSQHKGKDRRQRRAPKQGWVGRSGQTFVERTPWVLMLFRHSFEDEALECYDLEPIRYEPMQGVYEARVGVHVPVYGDPCTLHVQIEQGRASVNVEGWAGDLRHTYGHNRLCMWHPSDPDHQRWTPDKGLLALIDMAVLHLFGERHVSVTDEPWPGEEAPHSGDEPKVEATDRVTDDVAGARPAVPAHRPTRVSRAA